LLLTTILIGKTAQLQLWSDKYRDRGSSTAIDQQVIVTFNKSIPFTFLSKIKPEIFARFQEHLFRFPGFTPLIRSVRAYPHNNAAHVLGYLGEADSTKINTSNGLYDIGDFVGQNY